MGACFSRRTDTNILMLGLDNAGKTTILYNMKLGEPVSTIPTIGFNVETITYKHLNLVVWDVGGQDRIRVLWRHYYENADALIFVVDACDKARFGEAEDELFKIMSDRNMQHLKGLVVLANKQDMPNATSAKEVGQMLNVTRFRKPFCVQGTCGINSEGLVDTLDALSKMLSSS